MKSTQHTFQELLRLDIVEQISSFDQLVGDVNVRVIFVHIKQLRVAESKDG